MSEYQSNPNIGIYFSTSIVLMVVLLVIGLATDINSILVYVFFIITSFSAPSIIFIDDKDIKRLASILFIAIYALIFGLGFVEGENYTESERIHPDKYTQVKTQEMVAIFYLLERENPFPLGEGMRAKKNITLNENNVYLKYESTITKLIQKKKYPRAVGNLSLSACTVRYKDKQRKSKNMGSDEVSAGQKECSARTSESPTL